MSDQRNSVTEDAEKLRDDALRRALNTPPQPKKDSGKREEQKPKGKKSSD